jgi:hypothetical protein
METKIHDAAARQPVSIRILRSRHSLKRRSVSKKNGYFMLDASGIGADKFDCARFHAFRSFGCLAHY